MESKSLISLMFLLQAIMNGSKLIKAQKPRPTQQFSKCAKDNFKSDDLVKERDHAFDLLYKNFAPPGASSGFGTGNGDGIWTAALCPPNIKREACMECINNTVPFLKNKCPKNKEGVAWTVLPKLNCMVRYADARFLGHVADQWASTTFSSPPNQTLANADELEKGLNNLANKLKEPAAGGDNVKKYASGSVTYGPGSRTLYGSMQCTPEIEKNNCLKCLSDATSAIHNCCSKLRKLSATSFSGSCYFWYAHHNST